MDFGLMFVGRRPDGRKYNHKFIHNKKRGSSTRGKCLACNVWKKKHMVSKFRAKTVLGLTREEIEVLKSTLLCNLCMFGIYLMAFAFLLFIWKYSDTSHGQDVHIAFAALMVYQMAIGLLGFFGANAESSLLLLLYIILNAMSIIIEVLLIVYFNFYAEANVCDYFTKNLVLNILLIFLFAFNSIVTASALVVWYQLNRHGHVDKITLYTPSSQEESTSSDNPPKQKRRFEEITIYLRPSASSSSSLSTGESKSDGEVKTEEILLNMDTEKPAENSDSRKLSNTPTYDERETLPATLAQP